MLGSGALLALSGAVLLFGVTSALAPERGWRGVGGASTGRVEAPGVGVPWGAGVGDWRAGAAGAGVAPSVGVGSPGAGALPNGYYRTYPAGARPVYYGGYYCYYYNYVYYRPVFYQGATIYVAIPYQ
jgi:hypothetical protein